MFLNYLKDETKEEFLKLCVHAALANDVLENEEKEAISAYCREMDIEVHMPKIGSDFTDILNNIKENTTVIQKKIIILEILALVKSDGIYDEREQMFMLDLVRGLDIDETVISQLLILLDKYIEIGQELYSVVNE